LSKYFQIQLIGPPIDIGTPPGGRLGRGSMHYWAFAAVGYVISVHVLSPKFTGRIVSLGKLPRA